MLLRKMRLLHLLSFPGRAMRPARILKESGHPAHIFIVTGASCSRPSMERPAPCFEMELIKKHLYRSFIGRTYAEKGPCL
jgi:hypothetical protein